MLRLCVSAVNLEKRVWNAAVSNTSRSTFATSGVLEKIGCTHPSGVLRLVGATQPRS